MGVYTRRDSPYFWILFDGYLDPRGNPLREATRYRTDPPTAAQRKDNRAQAEQVYHDRMSALAREAHAVPGGQPRILFRQFLDWYVTNVLPTRRGKEREEEILPNLCRAFGDRWVHQIDRDAVIEYMTARHTTPHVVKGRTYLASPATINREVGVLKGILQAAVPKYLTSSPLYGMKHLRTVTPKRRIMTREEEIAIMLVMHPEDRAFFLAGLDTLTRLSDLIELRWADDHGERVWIADPKAGGGYEVPVSVRLRKALDGLPKISEYIFPRRRVAKTERDRRNSVKQMLRRACLTVGVPYGRKLGGLTFHWATRRTGATRMLINQVDPGTVQKVGRWKDPTIVLGIYHELVDAKARAAVEAVSRRDSGVIRFVQSSPKQSKPVQGRKVSRRGRMA